ncbi:MAG: PA1571 family protein [Moraxellaceae bacterium]
MQANDNLLSALSVIPGNGNPFQGAALLDESGREIPITEEMIVRACDELLKLWQYPGQAA